MCNWILRRLLGKGSLLLRGQIYEAIKDEKSKTDNE